MRKFLWLLPLLVVVPLLLTSTVICGCEPDPFSLAGQMEIFPVEGAKPAAVERNNELARQIFVGKDISKLTINNLPLDAECKFTRPPELRCEFWNETGLLYSSGRRVTINASGEGKVTAVSADSIWRWGAHD